jgi:methylglutaconyl-CoA hydratase
VETLALALDGRGVARVTLARAARHNALSAAMIAELTEAAARLAADPGVRVVVLAAEGESFCAGGDLAWMTAQIEADAQTRAAGARSLAMMLRALDELPQPLIARVHGNAFGGGVGLLSVCDLALGVAGTRFGLTETRLGLIPATIGPYVVARMGAARARRVMLSGRVFDAAEAVALGLLARVVPAGELDAALEAEVAAHLAAAPGAVAAAKRLIRRLGPPVDPAAIEASIAALIEVWEGPEARAGIAAFFDRRPPPWASRAP